LSPDGGQLAFSYQGAIWRLPREGGTMTRLSDGAGYDIEPAWSPDGSLIAFVNSPRMSGGAVRVVRAQTGEPVSLPATVDAIDTVVVLEARISPRRSAGREFPNRRQ
jgi:hypothetical protein